MTITADTIDDSSPRAEAAAEQHSLARSVALHLLPGLVGLAAFLIAAPIVLALGVPILLAFYLPMTLAIVAVELGYLAVQARRGGAESVGAVIGYREAMPAVRFVLLVVALFVAGVGLAAALGILDGILAATVFAGLPDWWLIRDLEQLRAHPRSALVFTLGVGLVMNGFVGPIVEEAYFRGHLLPRISRLGGWAPVMNAALFSLYHLWQPWLFFSRFGYSLPWIVTVSRTRSIYLGIALHCLGNLFALLALASQLLR